MRDTLPRRSWFFRHGVIALAMALGPWALAAENPPIAAASDLNAALPEIAEQFRQATGQSVRLTFGSSGKFALQIENGAPFEVFLSADEGYVERLAAAEKTEGTGALYAIGRIGVFYPTLAKIPADDQLVGLKAALEDGRLRKFAIANPEHAPYGRAAKEALQKVGLWQTLEPKLVLGENVAQATQFAISGSAQGGIIPLSLAMTPEVRAAGHFVLLPAEWHSPLRQRAVLLRGAGGTARAFFAYLQSPGARAIFEKYGFSLPNASP